MRYLVAFVLMVSCSEWRASCFDYASACARPYRSSRSRSPSAPCDLSKHSYCTTPGNGYPWHAIRRFVRENQGLMRRMYGEERHIAVLKAELENFIEDDDDEGNINRPNFAEDIIKTKIKYSKKNHGRGMNTRPHFRPINSNKKHDNDTLKVKPLEPKKNTTKANSTLTNATSEINESISYKTKLESIANIEINNLDPEVITLEAVIKQTAEKDSVTPSPKTNTDPSTNTIANDTLTNSTKDEIENTKHMDATTTDTDIENTTEAGKDDWKPIVSDTSTLPPTLLFSEHDKKNDKVEVVDKKEEHLKPSHQESLKPTVIKRGGKNACDIKEEMAAPFWANNTRGEVLALLNMYPFEQYIHLETCVHERKQQYCREGCRCEQQYRLHRLLAYDPRNECRGIFADWFKFPACCVCKCYDVPLEFRARSPRILHPQYDEEIKRAIYEDVARDWYAMGYYDDEEDVF